MEKQIVFDFVKNKLLNQGYSVENLSDCIIGSVNKHMCSNYRKYAPNSYYETTIGSRSSIEKFPYRQSSDILLLCQQGNVLCLEQ